MCDASVAVKQGHALRNNEIRLKGKRCGRGPVYKTAPRRPLTTGLLATPKRTRIADPRTPGNASRELYTSAARNRRTETQQLLTLCGQVSRE